MHVLSVKHINTFYGKMQALRDVSLEIGDAEIVALIGANGAGKTTLLKTITGVVSPASGKITFLGEHIEKLKSHAIVELGISHIPEGRKLFSQMSVLENLEMGAYSKRVWGRRKEIFDEVFDLLPFLRIRKAQITSTMSGGEQQMVAMGRGLMSKPKLCIIDEPSSGLAPLVVDEIFKIIKKLRSQGISVFLIEQNVQQTLEISDRGYVIENGRIVMEGDSKALLSDENIRKAYLGL
jgi:branched-chain amino acid transport system ATP-binding protein